MSNTPGPWEWSNDENTVSYRGSLIAIVYQAEDFPCLDEDEHPEARGEMIANARLITAAPELLEAAEYSRLLLMVAAEAARESGFEPKEFSFQVALSKTSDAIAKAKGER